MRRAFGQCPDHPELLAAFLEDRSESFFFLGRREQEQTARGLGVGGHEDSVFGDALPYVEVAFERGSYAEAIRRSQSALRQGAGWPARLLLGDAHAKVRDYEAAARDYREVLRAQPGHVEAQKRLELAERKASGG